MKLFLAAFLLPAAATLWAQTAERPRARPLPPTSKNHTTGPDIGGKVPGFDLPDQSGRTRTIASLAGKNGLLLYFVRSADW